MLNFNKALLPSSFEVVVSDSLYEFHVIITNLAHYENLNTFANECFRQVVARASEDGLKRKEFTDEMIEHYNKQIIQQFVKLCDIHDIKNERILANELKEFPEYYASGITSLMLGVSRGQTDYSISKLIEKRLYGVFHDWVDNSSLTTTAIYKGTIEITISLDIEVEAEDLRDADDIMESAGRDITQAMINNLDYQINSVIRNMRVYSSIEIPHMSMSDYESSVDNIYED